VRLILRLKGVDFSLFELPEILQCVFTIDFIRLVVTESRRLIFHCGFKCKVFSGGKKLIRKECGFVFRSFLGVFCLKRFCKSAVNQLLVWSTRQFVAVFDRNTLRLFLELANRDVVWVMEISLTTCCS
jgi:hypothetical protein